MSYDFGPYEFPMWLLYAVAVVLVALTVALAMVLYSVFRRRGAPRYFVIPLIFLLAPAGTVAALIVMLLLLMIVDMLRVALFGT